MEFMPTSMKNGEEKVPVHGSGPLGGSSWRSMVGDILDVWSLQNGGCDRPNVMRQFE